MNGEISSINALFVSRATPTQSVSLTSGLATASYVPQGTGGNFTSTLTVQVDTTWQGALVTCSNVDMSQSIETGRLIVQLVSKLNLQ